MLKKGVILIIILVIGVFLLNRSTDLQSLAEFEKKFGPAIEITPYICSEGILQNKKCIVSDKTEFAIKNPFFKVEDIVGGRTSLVCKTCVPEDEKSTFKPNQLVINNIVINSCPVPTTCEQLTFNRNIDWSSLPQDSKNLISSETTTNAISFEITPSILLGGINYIGVDNIVWYQSVECKSDNDCFNEQDILRLRSSHCDLREDSLTRYQCGTFFGTGAANQQFIPTRQTSQVQQQEEKKPFPLNILLIAIFIILISTGLFKKGLINAIKK